uniref:Deoxyribonuclease TATDN1 n=1 Tax=Syphacia muris TaxID=451379 RepID=A0A0N5AXZ2_9BILA
MGCYIGLTGFFWKDKSSDGVKYALQNGKIPLDKLLLETDAPFNYAKIHDKKIPASVRERISEKAQNLHRFSSFHRNEPSSLLGICELIAAYMGVSPKVVAKITTQNALKLFKLC